MSVAKALMLTTALVRLYSNRWVCELFIIRLFEFGWRNVRRSIHVSCIAIGDDRMSYEAAPHISGWLFDFMLSQSMRPKLAENIVFIDLWQTHGHAKNRFGIRLKCVHRIFKLITVVERIFRRHTFSMTCLKWTMTAVRMQIHAFAVSGKESPHHAYAFCSRGNNAFFVIYRFVLCTLLIEQRVHMRDGTTVRNDRYLRPAADSICACTWKVRILNEIYIWTQYAMYSCVSCDGIFVWHTRRRQRRPPCMRAKRFEVDNGIPI